MTQLYDQHLFVGYIKNTIFDCMHPTGHLPSQSLYACMGFYCVLVCVYGRGVQMFLHPNEEIIGGRQSNFAQC